MHQLPGAWNPADLKQLLSAAIEEMKRIDVFVKDVEGEAL